MSRLRRPWDIVFWFLFLFLVWLFCFGYRGACGSTSPQISHKAQLWLARACVGEAGWESVEGECAAIGYVIQKRVPVVRKPFLKVLKKYSWAIQYHPKHTRKWLLHLNRDLSKPKFWPKDANWERYVSRWQAVLSVASQFSEGGIPDPTPEANHWGGRMDAWRAKQWGWKRVKAPSHFRNQFFDSSSGDLSRRLLLMDGKPWGFQ